MIPNRVASIEGLDLALGCWPNDQWRFCTGNLAISDSGTIVLVPFWHKNCQNISESTMSCASSLRWCQTMAYLITGLSLQRFIAYAYTKLFSLEHDCVILIRKPATYDNWITLMTFLFLDIEKLNVLICPFLATDTLSTHTFSTRALQGRGSHLSQRLLTSHTAFLAIHIV